MKKGLFVLFAVILMTTFAMFRLGEVSAAAAAKNEWDRKKDVRGTRLRSNDP